MVAALDISELLSYLLLPAAAVISILFWGWLIHAFVQSFREDSEFRAWVLLILAVAAVSAGVWGLAQAGVIQW